MIKHESIVWRERRKNGFDDKKFSHFFLKFDILSFAELSSDGVVKTLHLLRCYTFSIITTYLSTPK